MTPGVALVTGSGAPRVGRAVARAFARAGRPVAVHYRTSAADAADAVAEMRLLGVESHAFQADLRDEAQVLRLADEVEARLGPVEVLVNSAAIWERKRLEDVTAADVRRHFDANALGTFLCCRRFGLAMAARPEGGAIVNLGDWAEVRPYRDYAAYFPSKGAVSALTRSFAVELGSRNPRVRVNAVLPGPVMLPDDLPEAERAAAIAATLVKREGSAEDVARAVLYLAESAFVTGVLVPVDGGRTVYGG